MALFGPINPEPQQNFLKGMGNVEDLRQMQLKNALAQIVNQYAPQQQQAELGLKEAQSFMNRGRGTNFLADASMAPSRINLMNAQAGRESAETRLAPLNALIHAQQVAQMSNRFGAAYQLARTLNTMPVEERAKWIAMNQQAFNDMLSTLGNKGEQVNMLTPELMKQFIPQANNALNTPAPQQSGSPSPMAAPQAMPGNLQEMPQPVPVNQAIGAPNMQTPFAQMTPEQTAELARINDMAANKGLTTAATRRQLEGAIQVENIINDPAIQQQVMNAAQYAGAARKGKAALDALSQKNPAAYEDYLAFKNQTQVLLQNRIKTLDQMGATDKQREELQGLYTKTLDSLTSNPGQFITQFNKLGKTLNTIAQSVQKSASPVANLNRLTGFKPIPEATAPSEKINVIAPDGRSGSIPASQLQEALKAGYREG